MHRYRLLHSTHVGENGREYQANTKNDIVVTSRPLDKLYINKFVDLGPVEVEQPKAAPAEKQKGESTVTDHGEDVTADFEAAEEADLQVFKSGRNYTVVDPDDDSVIKSDLTSKKAVNEFIADYVS